MELKKNKDTASKTNPKQPIRKNKPPFNPVAKKDNDNIYNCHYCGELYKQEEITKDHKTPKCNGGTNNTNNLVPACINCNRKKDDIPYQKFMTLIQEFGIDFIRVAIPVGFHSYSQITNGLLYYSQKNEPKVLVNTSIGLGSRILTTITIGQRIHLIISKKH